MAYFLLGLAALILVLVAGHSLSNTNPALLARVVRGAGGTIAVGLALVLLARGAVAFAIPVGTFGLWLLSHALDSPAASGTASSGPSRTSQVKTDTLEMALDLDTGEVAGRVIKGRYAGQKVEDMAPADLAALWSDCQFSDPQSAQIIEAYLDRRHPTWRDDMARASGKEDGGGTGQDDAGSGANRGSRTGARATSMTVAEAFEVLGLRRDADRDAVLSAHKSMMLKYHPDRGGSDYFAAKLNEAKSVLLNHLDG